MTIRKLIVVILANSFLIACDLSAYLAQTGAQGDNSSNTIKVGIVKDRDFFDGAGCSLQLPANYQKHNERYVFLSDYQDKAVININGKDTKLRLVSHRGPAGDPKKGDRSTWNYAAQGGTTVRVDFVVTGVCDPNDESCEVTYYNATITVTRGNAKQVVKVKGLCGS